jgi:hypothetical protein
VLSYLVAQPNVLYAHVERDGGKQFACPATWQTVSHDVYTLEALGESLVSERTANRIASSINTVQAAGLVEYIRNNEVLISPDEVLRKYKPKSELRKRVIALQKDPGGAFQNLAQKVADELFHAHPEVHEVVDCLAQFWADMPIELRAPYFNQLRASATSPDKAQQDKHLEYMKKLTTALNKNPLWDKITQTSIQAETAGKEELEAGREAAKALKQGAPAR